MVKQYFILLLIISQIYSSSRVLEESLSDDIIILHTNDVHCGVKDTIGYDGFMLYKKQLMKKYKNIITVDVGDHIQGAIIGLITNGEAIIDIMNKIEYDVATLGNHEFDYGIAQLNDLNKRLNCSYISSNYCFRENQTSIFPPYKIIEKGSKKIGFIGAVTPQTLSKSYLISILDKDGNTVYDFLAGNHTQDLYNRLQEQINKLRNEEKVDYVIILGHLGIGGDALEENTSAGVLKNLEGVDAFLDGHTHLIYSQTSPDKTGKNITLAQTGTKLTNIGVLKIHTNGTLSHENIEEVPYDPLLANESLNVTRGGKQVYVNKEIYDYINEIMDSFSDELNRVVGKTAFPLSLYANASAHNVDAHLQLSRVSENALCNLVADSFREYGESDITIITASAIRTDIEQGDITYQEVINTMPFSNDILVKRINGQTILDTLEFAVSSLPKSKSRFPQVSGMTFKIDVSIDSPVVMDDNELFVSVNGERRVYDVKINGENIDPKKNYTITSNQYNLDGGGGFTMLKPLETLKDSIGVDNELFLNYIQEKLGGVIPSKYNQTEGRIIITNGKINNTSNNTDMNSTDNNYISLLGFSGLNINDSKIKFNTHFLNLNNFNFPYNFTLYLTLFSNSFLRLLDSKNETAICNIDNTVYSENKVKYICEAPTSTKDIDSIKINSNIKLNNNENIEISPLALKYMNNIKNCPTDEQLNLPIYILENAKLNKYDKQYFNISGTIDKNLTHPVINNTNLVLMITELPDKTEEEINCNIIYLTGNNYNLNCELNDNNNYDLEGSTSILENKILFVKFSNNDTNITSEPTENKEYSYRKYYRNSSRKLNAGAIVAIILIPIVVVAALIAVWFFSKKSNINEKQSNTSSIVEVKNIK